MAKAIKYEIGDTHRHWTIIGHADRCGRNRRQVMVRCKCGAERIASLSSITLAKSNNCQKCPVKPKQPTQRIAKKRYGKLKVLEQKRGKMNDKCILVQCDCGKKPYWVRRGNLEYRGTVQCPSCSARARSYNGKSGVKLSKKKAKSRQPQQMAIINRNQGVCHEGGLCSHYRECGDRLFECK